MPRPPKHDTRDKVTRMHAKGLTVREMADRLKVATQTVYHYHQALGLTPNKPPQKRVAS